MPPEKSNRRLGRGLDALFNTPPVNEPDSALREIPIAEVSGNPYQPRKNFSETELRELEESLRVNGLLQAVTVRAVPGGRGYQLIAGERRLRAASNLGWKEIPAVVKELSDREMLTLALVENLQRFDLNPIEEGEGYDRLIREFGYTQQTVATLVGKDRSTVSNVIRLLQLPEGVRSLVQQGRLTSGQARPLLGLADNKRATSLAQLIVDQGLSAREVESRVREAEAPPEKPKRGRPRKEDRRSAEVKSIEQRLRKHLQTDVSVVLKKDDRGSLVIEFYSADDLERLLEILGVGGNPQQYPHST